MRILFKKIFFLILLLTATATQAQHTTIVADELVKISHAEASEAQPNEGIDKSFDGDRSTMYHSIWRRSATFPVILTYYFDDVEQIDYLVYHPRLWTPSGYTGNGNFMEFELWVSYGNEQTDFVKYGDYDFEGSEQPSKISFSEGLISPKAVRFVVKSGKNNFVNCAEICFYKINKQSIIPPFFIDETCTELRDGITLETVKAIENDFYKQLAMSLFNNSYDKKYRVWEIKTTPSGFNCKSISVKKGDKIIVFVGNTGGGNMFLKVHNDANVYLLNEGVNVIIADASGLLCPRYINNNSNAKSAKIHFATGKIRKRHYNALRRGGSVASTKIDTVKINWSQIHTPKQMKNDINFFFKFVSKSHPNMYAFVSKDSMKIRKKELYNNCSEPMSVKEFHNQIVQLNGMFDEHTGIPFNFDQYVSAKLVFPTDIKVVGKELFINKNDSYDKVLTINNQCVDDIFAVLSAIYHKKSVNAQSVDLLLSTVFPVLLYHLTDCRSPFTLRVEDVDGNESEYTVQGTTDDDFNRNETLFADSLRDFRSYPVDSIAIIEYNSCTDSDGFSDWISEVFTKISDDNIQHLFIDISRNGGGETLANNYIFDKIVHKEIHITAQIKVNFSKYFIKKNTGIGNVYPKILRPPLRAYVYLKYGKNYKTTNVEKYPANSDGYKGNIYLIQGPRTYSAAVDMSAWFKYSGIGSIIGEETGGPGASYSSALNNRLPNSKLHIRSASNYVKYPGGKVDRGILPDIPIELDYSKKGYELDDLKRFLAIIKSTN